LLFDFIHRQKPVSQWTILTGCLIFAAAIASLDGFVFRDLSLGILYIVPLIVAAFFLTRWQILAAAAVATFLREQFGPNPWEGDDALGRVAMGLLAFAGAGLFAGEMVRRRAESFKRIAEQETLRQDAVEEARVLTQGSPTAILTINPDGCIGLANDAARRLLGFDGDSPEGEQIGLYLPMLSDLLKSRRAATFVRTMVEGSGAAAARRAVRTSRKISVASQ
jgi:PAS domain-containing protein